MKKLVIAGGSSLHGEINIQGSKNAALPVLAACLLGEGICQIENCPQIRDVADTLRIMEKLGCQIQRKNSLLEIDASRVEKTEICSMEASRIRSSVLFLGALLGRMKKAVLPLPGGCAIGRRPIDAHLCSLASLGVVFTIDEKITAKAERLTGTDIRLAVPSVGATENLILAAVTAEGNTRIINGAKEPEIDELCLFLNQRGACIRRLVNGTILIHGVRRLRSVCFRLQSDRIVAGTYMLAAAACGGACTFLNIDPDKQCALLKLLKQMDIQTETGTNQITIRSSGILQADFSVETAPYPGFPTDLQSPLMAAMCRSEGCLVIRERMFESRFRTAYELCKLGADIRIYGDTAIVHGVKRLHGATLKAPDLRGGAALVIAALQADGITTITDTEYITRGYENISRDLSLLGAQVIKWKEEEA